VFKALADPSRRTVLDAHDGRTLNDLCAHLQLVHALTRLFQQHEIDTRMAAAESCHRLRRSIDHRAWS
jgi:hypothetical protein